MGAPSSGVLKFNVDGSSKGKPGHAGMGGILRDSNGHVICVFSSYLGILDSNAAELLAICRALQVFFYCDLSPTYSLIVESDSMVALSWVTKLQGFPWKLNSIINYISHLKKRVGQVDFIHTPREVNDMADHLAKRGVNDDNSLLAWLKVS
jgi:ribonuclease HI